METNSQNSAVTRTLTVSPVRSCDKLALPQSRLPLAAPRASSFPLENSDFLGSIDNQREGTDGQGDQEFKSTLNCIDRQRPAWAVEDPVSNSRKWAS